LLSKTLNKRTLFLLSLTPAQVFSARKRLAQKLVLVGSGCHVFSGAKSGTGYGSIFVGSKKSRMVLGCHVLALFLERGPSGVQQETVNHLCGNRACCNPAHLQAASVRENVLHGNSMAARNAARSHCVQGHEFTPENTKIRTDGGKIRRACRKCHHGKVAR
jgi:HNH endonuclease